MFILFKDRPIISKLRETDHFCSGCTKQSHFKKTIS